MQTKFRNGKQFHRIVAEYPDYYVTECGRRVTSRFRFRLKHPVTCIQCLQKMDKENAKR